MDDQLFLKQSHMCHVPGIPLKGETHKPKSMFDDADKVWFPPEPLPALPKDFKEHPDRDLVESIQF